MILYTLGSQLTIPDLPWSAILTFVVLAYTSFKSYVWLRAKDRFVLKPEKPDEQFVTRHDLEVSVHQRNEKIKEVDEHLAELMSDLKSDIKELRFMVETNYARKTDLDGVGKRIDEAEERQDAFINLMEGVRNVAETARQKSDQMSERLSAHIEIMNERLKPLDRLEKSIDRISDMLMTRQRLDHI